MRASPAKQRTRPVLFGIVAALLALVLSGCVKLNADFQIAEDETVSGSLSMLMDPRAMEDLGEPFDEAELDSAVADMQSDPSVPDGVTVEKLIDDDGYMGMLMTFDRVPAEEFSTGSATSEFGGPSVEGISVSSADGEISFEMSNPVAAAGSEAGLGSMRSVFDEARVSVSFPGAVIEAPGAEISGKTAAWELRDFEGDTLSATANASGFPWWIVFVVVGAVVVLGAAALIVFLVLRSRKKPQGGALGGPGVPGGFPGAPGGPYPGAPAGPGAPGGPGGHPGGQYPGHRGGPHPGGPAGPGYPGGARPQGPMGGSGPVGPAAPGAYPGGPSAPGSGAPPVGPPPGYAQPSQPGAGGYPGAPQQGGQGYPHPGTGARPGPMPAPHHPGPPTHPQHPQHPQQGPGAVPGSGPQVPGAQPDGRDPGDDSRFAPPGQR